MVVVLEVAHTEYARVVARVVAHTVVVLMVQRIHCLEKLVLYPSIISISSLSRLGNASVPCEG